MTKKDILVHPNRLSDSGLQDKVVSLLEEQRWRGVVPSVGKALLLGVVEPNNMSPDLIAHALVRTASQTASDDSSFERLARVLSDNGAPFSSYAEVVANPRVKEQTIITMRGMLEGGSTPSEWLNGIAQFDAFVKNHVLEPFVALPDTPGDPAAEAKKEILETIPDLYKEFDELNKKIDAIDKKPQPKKGEKSKNGGEDEREKIEQRIREVVYDIQVLSGRYSPSGREALFLPYRRLSKAELMDTISKTLNVQLTRLANTFKNGHDKDFVDLRDELLKERGGDTYWQYRILQKSDLLYPRFAGYIDGIAVKRLQDLASQPEKQKATRKFFVDKNIASDAVLLSHEV